MKVSVKLTQKITTYLELSQGEKKFNHESKIENEKIKAFNSTCEPYEKKKKIKLKKRAIGEQYPVNIEFALEFDDVNPIKDKDKAKIQAQKLRERVEGAIIYQVLQTYDNKVNYNQDLNGFSFNRPFEVEIMVNDKVGTSQSVKETVKLSEKTLPLFVYHISQVLNVCFDTNEGKVPNIKKAIELSVKKNKEKILFIAEIQKVQTKAIELVTK